MKKIIPILILCAGLFTYSSCTKETPTPDPTPGPTPCETKTWYEDADGDGQGNPAVSLENCDQPDGYVLDNTDPIDMSVERNQVPMMAKISGETCPPCGGWGWTAWSDLSADFYGKAFCFTTYGTFVSNGNFRGQELTPTMQTFQDRFWTSGSKPSFMTSNTDHGTTPANAATAANTEIATQAKVAAVLDYKLEGDQLTVTAEVEFFENMIGDYVLGAYLVEDKVLGYQAGYSDPNNAKHHFVMRGSLSDNAWGESIATGSANAGDKMVKTFTATIPSNYNPENLSYGVVVWRKYPQTHLFINSYTTQGL